MATSDYMTQFTILKLFAPKPFQEARMFKGGLRKVILERVSMMRLGITAEVYYTTMIIERELTSSCFDKP